MYYLIVIGASILVLIGNLSIAKYSYLMKKRPNPKYKGAVIAWIISTLLFLTMAIAGDLKDRGIIGDDFWLLRFFDSIFSKRW